MGILKQADSRVPAVALRRQQGMSSATFYKWPAKYGDVDPSMMSEKKVLERTP